MAWPGPTVWRQLHSLWLSLDVFFPHRVEHESEKWINLAGLLIFICYYYFAHFIPTVTQSPLQKSTAAIKNLKEKTCISKQSDICTGILSSLFNLAKRPFTPTMTIKITILAFTLTNDPSLCTCQRMSKIQRFTIEFQLFIVFNTDLKVIPNILSHMLLLCSLWCLCVIHINYKLLKVTVIIPDMNNLRWIHHYGYMFFLMILFGPTVVWPVPGL